MTPGSVAMLLGETTGLRVQTDRPVARRRERADPGPSRPLLAAARRRPAALRRAGDSLSLLQVPPLDLGQVEIIKGVASALYGPSAIGGVVNLVSQRPGSRARGAVQPDVAVGRDATSGWLAPAAGTGLDGPRRLPRPDAAGPDDDGWSDLPSFDRGVLRPRLLGRRLGPSVFATVGGMAENRAGGTQPGPRRRTACPSPRTLDSRHADAGPLGRLLLGRPLVAVRGSFTHQRERAAARRRARARAPRPASGRPSLPCSAGSAHVARRRHAPARRFASAGPAPLRLRRSRRPPCSRRTTSRSARTWRLGGAPAPTSTRATGAS